MKNDHEICFSIGTGRCGTTFLYKLMELQKGIASFHERDALPDTFHRFCKWYDIPIDNRGFLKNKRNKIEEDLKSNQVSFESSAYLSLSIKELYNEFNSKFVFLIRDPEKVVRSYSTKGWYSDELQIDDINLPPSYQSSKHFHHFLGRTLPKGEDIKIWSSWTRVGKIAWFWNKINHEILKQLQEIPSDNYQILRLEDLTFEKYEILTKEFLGIQPSVTKSIFNNLVESKPNNFKAQESVLWSGIEREEFSRNVKEIASTFDYGLR